MNFLLPILPEVILAVFGCLLIVVQSLAREEVSRRASGWLALLGTAAAFVSVLFMRNAPESSFGGLLTVDGLRIFFAALILIIAGFTVISSFTYLKRHPTIPFEYYPILLFGTSGMLLMVATQDLITFFVALEILSISLYVMAALSRGNDRSAESALKYLLLGAFSSGFLLYGIALIYGATGTTSISEASRALAIGDAGLLGMAGAGFLLVGLAFKVAAFPFHAWAPDVYEGAPTPITMYMSGGTKAAAFAILVRLFATPIYGPEVDWSRVLWWMAVLTMTTGNILALTQENVKRMLAYSSIAHAGYALVGLVVGGPAGHSSVLFYLAVYAVMNIGSFGVVSCLEREGGKNLQYADYSGLARRHAGLGLAMAIFMFALAGLPPTAGFLGKFYLFAGAVDAGYVGLAVIGVLNSALSLYYYLRLTVLMYMREPRPDIADFTTSPSLVIVLVVSALTILQLGVLPGRLLEWVQRSVMGI